MCKLLLSNEFWCDQVTYKVKTTEHAKKDIQYLHYTTTYTIAFAHFVLEQNQEV